MKQHMFLKAMLWLLVPVSFFSCEKFSEDELFENKEANSTLVIHTRAAAGENEGTISYPVNVYVFDESDRCVEVSSIGSGEEELSMDLPEGTYDIYAVAGAAEEAYDLPTKENATKETVVSLKEGYGHGDLMTAHNKVVLTFGEENSLTLTLERKVMLLESVTISNVPASVTAVSVTINPLYESLLLNGEYSGSEGIYEVELTKDADGTTWKSTEGEYLLEAAGKATVGISFTTESKKMTYSYSCPEDLEANHKIVISGNFTGTDVALKGSITGVEWEGTTNITFDFDENGTGPAVDSDDEGGATDDVVIDENAPKAGEMYKGCYVLRADTLETQTVLTLMSAKSKAGLDIQTNKDETISQEVLKSAIDEIIPTLAVSDFDGWRLPTEEEMEFIGSNLDSISDKIKEIRNTQGLDVIDNFAYGSRFYYYLMSKGGISSYDPVQNKGNHTPAAGTSFIVRAFTTVTLQN